MEIIEFLIKSGADSDVENDDGLTPLCLAAGINNLESVKSLVTYGSDINYRMKSGKFEMGSVMHFTAANSNLDTFELLLELGGDVHLKDWRGRTPLQWCVREGEVDVMKSLLKYTNGDLYAVDNGGLSLLHLAAAGGNTQTAEWLLKNRFDPETREVTGWTALHSAAEYGQLGMIELLLNYKADVNAKTWERSTPLHFAALQGQLLVVRHLVQRGAEVNTLDHNTWTPLQLALREGHSEIVDLLKSIGGKVGGASVNQFVGCPLFF